MSSVDGTTNYEMTAEGKERADAAIEGGDVQGAAQAVLDDWQRQPLLWRWFGIGRRGDYEE